MRRAVILLAGLAVACGGGSSIDSGSEKGASDAPPQWQQLPAPGLPARAGSTIAWTGAEILVVGGSTYRCPPSADCVGPTEPPFRDGAALDPRTGKWRPIADAPLPVPPHQPTAQLDSDAYVLVTPWARSLAHQSTVLLRYRPATNNWSAHAVPSAGTGGRLIATATDLVVYPGSDERGETPDLRFDPAAESWSPLPADPLSPSFDRTYAWNGQALHLFAKTIAPSPGGASGPSLINAAVLEDDTWHRLDTGPFIGFQDLIVDDDRIIAPTLGCADGGATNNYGRCIPYGAVFDTATRTWSDLPNTPSPGDKNSRSSGALTPTKLLLTAPGNPMLDLSTNTWFRMPEIAKADNRATVQRTIAAAGRYGVAFGGVRFAPDDPAGTLLGDAWLWAPTNRTVTR